MQHFSSWLWGFHLLLLRLHGAVSLSLLCSHSSWGSSLVFAPALHIGHSQESVPLPDRRGLKQQLITALLLTQAWEKEGYSSHNWTVGQAWGGRGQHDIATAWGTPCVPPGKLSWIVGPWQWRAAQASRVVWVVTCAYLQDSWWQ